MLKSNNKQGLRDQFRYVQTAKRAPRLKAAALRINLNIDGAPIASRSHTHPSFSHS